MEIKREQRTFKQGEIVRTRSDIGGMYFKITEIHNEHYCEARSLICGIPFGRFRHFNMDVFDKLEVGE